MATTKITDLTAYTDPVNTDVLPIVDVTSDVTKKVSIANVMKNASLGTAAAPGIAFDGDPNTGIYSPGADQVAITTGGTARLTSSTTAVTSALPVDHPLGSAAAPTVTFTGDLNTGIYSPGADQVSVATGGTERLRIDSTGQIEAVSLGTAAAPIFTFTGDPDTGVYSPGANQLAISTNGTGRLFVDSSGRVGIGTNAPDLELVLEDSQNTGTTADNVGATIRSVNRSSLLRLTSNPSFSSTIELGDTDATGTGAIAYNNSNNNLFFTVNSSERLRITSAGLVGIGTSSPEGTINVQGSTAAPSLTYDTGNIGNFDAGTIQLALGIHNAAPFGAYLQGRDTGNASRVISLNPVGGNVGIGTTSPGAALDVSGNIRLSAGNPNIEFNNGGAMVYGPAGNTLAFATGGGPGAPQEKARIDSSGRLLVGTSSSVDSNCLIQSINAGESSVALGRNDATVSAGNVVGGLTFYGNSDGVYDDIGYVRCVADGTHTTSGTISKPTRLEFSVTSDGASSPTERMRINNAGDILFVSSANKAGIDAGTADGKYFSSTGARLISSRSATTLVAHQIFINGNGQVGSITTDGSATSYTTSSDYRLKENITLVTDGITRLQQLKPSRFNFIADPIKTVDGFIAHEVQAVVPEAITGEKDAEDADGNPIYQGIDQSKLVPLLTAALQEAIAKIESLEARLTAAGI